MNQPDFTAELSCADPHAAVRLIAQDRVKRANCAGDASRMIGIAEAMRRHDPVAALRYYDSIGLRAKINSGAATIHTHPESRLFARDFAGDL